MNYRTYLLLLNLILLQYISFGQGIRVGILGQHPDEDLQELFVVTDELGHRSTRIHPGHLESEIPPDSLDVIWLQYDNDDFFRKEGEISASEEALLSYVSRGGNLVLSLKAAELINRWGVEPIPVERVTKEVRDEGYGRMLGYHAYLKHPLFAGLNGGAYVLKPEKDTTVNCYGYFEGNVPEAGRVIGVDWDYIFLRKNKKLIMEYRVGAGKILVIGSYLHFSMPNRNKLHLEKFTDNIFNYLAGDPAADENYWHFGHPIVEEFEPLFEKQDLAPSAPWEKNIETPTLHNNYGRENYWDLGGRRILIMGKEQSGIEEIWTHPFMALRDYEVGIRFSYADTIIWLEGMIPEVAMAPGSFTRQYKFRRGFLKETIVASQRSPGGIVHYEYRGVYPAEIFIRFKTNLRLMWPYPADVTGGLYHGWSEKANCFVVSDPSGTFVSMVGSNQVPAWKYIGRNPQDSLSYHLLPGIPEGQTMVSAIMKFDLEMNQNLDIILSASNRGMQETASFFERIRENPFRTYEETASFWNDFLESSLEIESPDHEFNEGYQWALLSTERFFVETPGIGTSLTAGYATTAHGWDGGQEVSGRPGYAWYFGRDAQWSALAVLGYGNHEGVREVLEVFNEFQDLTGKIYHELSTSGFVHYDASDATPLYLVLAGRYLQHSGDVQFIDSTWNHLKSAINFCYNTDTDGDLLIENTNVGHGWVEGGHLFGSHTSLYLASCWAAALEASSYMAERTGRNELSKKYLDDAQIVRNKINNLYWNPDNQFFNHGLKMDGTFITDETIMPAIPLLFGQIESEERKNHVLNAFSRNAYTSDWGCRIVSKFSPRFNPRGYHTGSVWPLYTGWASLAEYRNGYPLQGYFHLMNNLLVYKYWGAGFVEEVLNGEQYLPSGVCHHQCWSETMVLQPAIEGLLGFRPDAGQDRLILSPRIPAEWDSLKVGNIRIGDEVLNFRYERTDDRTSYYFDVEKGDGLTIWFSPSFLPGTRITDMVIREKEIKPARKINTKGVRPFADFVLRVDSSLTLDVFTEGGISAITPLPVVRPGYQSNGFRIVQEEHSRGRYRILLEGISNSRELLEIISFSPPGAIEGATLIEKSGNHRYILRVDFPDRESEFTDHWITIKTE